MAIITIHMRKNDGLGKKKKNFFLYFHIREVLSHSRECGSWAAFPGGSRMIREGSHVWITIFATKIDFFFRREKTSLSGTPVSLPKIADLPISFQANITCMDLTAQEQSDQRQHCHSVCIFQRHYSMVKEHCWNFRMIKSNFSVIWIFQYVYGSLTLLGSWQPVVWDDLPSLDPGNL